MQRLDPSISFRPALEAEFGRDNVIVVKHARGGQPIKRWYKKWKSADGESPETTGDLYERLIKAVAAAIAGEKIATVTFVWSQGERDAKDKQGAVYAESLRGLIKQLGTDLGRDDINFVIGRLNDPKNKMRKYPHWAMIRQAQMEVSDQTPRGDWINTDDLGTKVHYSDEGYRMMGERFAEKAIELINVNTEKQ